MPAISAAMIGLDLLCIVHILRSGRPYQWIFLVTFVPIAGAVAYFVVEMLPELRHSRAARKAVKDIGQVVDPDREFRELIGRVDELDTVENKLALARECLKRERHGDAISLLEGCLVGVHADDIAVLATLAQAHFAEENYRETRAVLDRLREAHPDLSCPEGHLLYARSLEAEGEVERALIEYEALVGYYPGEEARCRYGLLLRNLGHVDQSRSIFEDVKRSVERASKVYFRSEKDWYEMAKGNLA